MLEKQKFIIFDLGAVMVDWNPLAIAQNFTKDTELQHSIVQGLFHHEMWINFDNGLMNEAELIQHAGQVLKLNKTQTSNLMQQAKESLHAKLDMVALLKLAKKHQLKTYCLSNLSHEWFDYLSNRHEFFNFFDGKVISAQEGIGKPNIEIYRRLLNRYKVDTHQTLFIDDRHENTQAASGLGIKSITFKHSQDDLDNIKQFVLTR